MKTVTEEPTSAKNTKSSNSFCLEAFYAALPQWAQRLQMRVEQSIQASDQNLGHLEELVLKDTKEIQRKAVEQAAGGRSGNGDRTFGRSKNSTRHPGSGSQAAGRTSPAIAQRNG